MCPFHRGPDEMILSKIDSPDNLSIVGKSLNSRVFLCVNFTLLSKPLECEDLMVGSWC